MVWFLEALFFTSFIHSTGIYLLSSTALDAKGYKNDVIVKLLTSDIFEETQDTRVKYD
jgi:hypothetical protein